MKSLVVLQQSQKKNTHTQTICFIHFHRYEDFTVVCSIVSWYLADVLLKLCGNRSGNCVEKFWANITNPKAAFKTRFFYICYVRDDVIDRRLFMFIYENDTDLVRIYFFTETKIHWFHANLNFKHFSNTKWVYYHVFRDWCKDTVWWNILKEWRKGDLTKDFTFNEAAKNRSR